MCKDQTFRNAESVPQSSFVYCLKIFGRLYIAAWGGDFLGGNFFFEPSPAAKYGSNASENLGQIFCTVGTPEEELICLFWRIKV